MTVSRTRLPTRGATIRSQVHVWALRWLSSHAARAAPRLVISASVMARDRAPEARPLLFAAARDSLAADTPGRRAYRARRAARGMLSGAVPLPADIARPIQAHTRSPDPRP